MNQEDSIVLSSPINKVELSGESKQLINEIKEENLQTPILKFLQKIFVKGRTLDVADMNTDSEGETNYICVDRENVLQSTFEELESITDYRVTFGVDFLGEMAKDYGGPKKECIALVNKAIKKKKKKENFDNELRDLLADKYFFVGIMVAIALFENGQLPVYMHETTIQSIFGSNDTSPCILKLREGLHVFYLDILMKELRVLQHLLHPNLMPLNAKMILQILKPNFSPDGSTAFSREKSVYGLFVKYVRSSTSKWNMRLILFKYI